MEFVIGSINMYKFSRQKDKEISKDYAKIAKVICDEEFDVVALQEVFNEYAVKSLVRDYLKPNWDYVWEAPTSRSQQAAEGYAFIWNTRRFRLATGIKKDEQNGNASDEKAHRRFMPRIHSQYDPDQFLFQGKLIRDPLYARFESIYGWYELRLINTHIMYNDTKTDDDEGEKDKRRRELEILMDIYHQIESKKYRNDRVAYTFLLGDYNLSIKDISKLENVDRNRSNDFEVYKIITDRNNEKQSIITVQHELSTLKKSPPADPQNSEEVFANNFDHFTFSEEMKIERKVDMQYARVDSVNDSRYWDGDVQAHRKEFSDHVPIKLAGSFK